MGDAKLFDHLRALETLGSVPDEELRWLIDHGDCRTCEEGAVIAPRGQRIATLWLLLSGRISVRVDRGAGLRRVLEWRTGEVSGMLPYSRMVGPPGDNAAVERTEILEVPVAVFDEMAHCCPAFTAFCVHSMLDRARAFSASDLRDEKMVSLGKLAAGLAHELNNPASAAARSAKLLQQALVEGDRATRRLGAADVDAVVFETMERAGRGSGGSGVGELSPLGRADREDDIATWLEARGLDGALAGPLADTTLAPADLDRVAADVGSERLDAALRWLTARALTHALADEIAESADRMNELVQVLKRFTYMDTRSGARVVHVAQGLRDTVEVLGAKAAARGATVRIGIDPGLAAVEAPGDELNQVWMCLLDNALDWVEEGGTVDVAACMEVGRVVVRVVDDGPGIPPEVQPHVFDPFFTTKPPGQGTGLGLEIARRIARSSLGDITVESRPGRTEFRVSLPAATEAATGA